jgi:hypothetical protein
MGGVRVWARAPDQALVVAGRLVSFVVEFGPVDTSGSIILSA